MLLNEFKSYSSIELWAEIKNSQSQAFDELISRYWKLLFDRAFNRLQSTDIAKDLVQDVFLNIWLKREGLDIENMDAYLTSAIRYRVYTYFARNPLSQQVSDLFADITSGCFDTADKLSFSELRSLVRAWIETLSPKRREVFILYLERHMTTKEIAAELKISQKTVQNHLNRSMPALRSRLSGVHSVIFLFL